MLCDMQYNSFEDPLQAGGVVAMMLVEGAALPARALRQSGRGDRFIPSPRCRQRIAAFGKQLVKPVEVRIVPVRIPVWGKAHRLIFIEPFIAEEEELSGIEVSKGNI